MSVQNIILIIIVIILLFFFLKYIYSDKTRISGLQDAKLAKEVSSAELSNPNNMSNFAYSCWIYISNWNYRYGDEKIVLLRKDATGNPCPMIYLDKLENNLIAKFACFSSSDQTHTPEEFNCTLNNIPLQTWCNVTISIYNRTLDMYLNGKLVRTCILPGVPIMDQSTSLTITPQGGFAGYTSNVNFYGHPLNPREAYNIYRDGFTGGGVLDYFGRYSVKVALYKDAQEQASLAI